MSQNRKENTQTTLPPLPKIDRKHSQPPAPLPKEKKPWAFRVHAPSPRWLSTILILTFCRP